MMKTHTILTGLMVILATWSSGVNGQASQQKPPLCCIPDQWTLKQTISYLKINRGNFEYGEVLSNWTYDSINQRELYVTTRSDNLGPQQQLVYYLLFQENMMYVYNNQTDMCIKQTLNRPFYRRCIPAFATVEDSGAIFGTGAETINATRVKFQYPMMHGGSLNVSLTVSQDCIPLVEKFTVYPWGAGGMDMETIESTDMKIYRVPDSLFEHPRACCNARFARPEHYPSISFDF